MGDDGPDDLFCAVYVHPHDRLTLRDMTEVVAADADGLVEADVSRNDDYDAGAAAEGTGDFLAFPFRVEVFPLDESWSTAEMAKRVGRLLLAFRARGYDYAAAATYEHLLPGEGRTRLIVSSPIPLSKPFRRWEERWLGEPPR